jgi:hypothetical protein
MPPPESNKSLTEEEKGILKRWIGGGAQYQPHWAFVSPRKMTPFSAFGVRGTRLINLFFLLGFEKVYDVFAVVLLFFFSHFEALLGLFKCVFGPRVALEVVAAEGDQQVDPGV